MTEPSEHPPRTAKYLDVAREILELIEGGLGPHEALPTERELQQRFSVSRATIRSALARLAREGRVYSVHGSGTYVADPLVVRKGLRLSPFTEDMRGRGHEPGSARIRVEAATAARTPEAEPLALEDEDEVWVLRRVRLADGEPMAVETAVVPASFWQGGAGPSGEGSLDQQLAALGHGPVRARQSIDAVNLDPDEAKDLDQAVGAAALRVVRVAEDSSGIVVQAVRTVYRSDRYGFELTVTREGAPS